MTLVDWLIMFYVVSCTGVVTGALIGYAIAGVMRLLHLGRWYRCRHRWLSLEGSILRCVRCGVIRDEDLDG